MKYISPYLSCGYFSPQKMWLFSTRTKNSFHLIFIVMSYRLEKIYPKIFLLFLLFAHFKLMQQIAKHHRTNTAVTSKKKRYGFDASYEWQKDKIWQSHRLKYFWASVFYLRSRHVCEFGHFSYVTDHVSKETTGSGDEQSFWVMFTRSPQNARAIVSAFYSGSVCKNRCKILTYSL